MRRRQAITALVGGVGGWPVAVSAQQTAWRPLALPEPAAQLAVGGPRSLLAVGLSGGLFAMSLDGTAAERLATDIDPGVALGLGHGRIAARRRDGALWVLEGGRAGASRAGALAPWAGLLVLPLAVIGVQSEGARHRAVRLEETGANAWTRVATSAVDVLPDARPLQADLDGSGDGGHVAVLAGPDAERYAHGVLGDRLEATRLVLLERHGLQVMRELTLEAPHVFEDIAPRRVALGSRDGLLSVRSGPQGGQLVLVDADKERGALRVAALGDALGTVNRWMAPTTDGQHWLAVHTPHIGGRLHHYLRDGDRLVARLLAEGVSNHRIGSRTLDQSAWQGERLWIPDTSGRRVRVIDVRSSRVAAEFAVPATVTALAAARPSGPVVALLADGVVGVVGDA